MIKRIVKMTFRPAEVPVFLADFEAIKDKVRNQPGCRSLELLQGIHDTNVFFTYSYWDSEDDLNAYRGTELFGQVWKRTKAKFAERAEAWSVNSVSELK